MNSPPRPVRQRHVPIAADEPASPVIETPKRSDTFEDDSKTTYESTQEDNDDDDDGDDEDDEEKSPSDDTPPSILSKDPFSSESSRTLFEAIGMSSLAWLSNV